MCSKKLLGKISGRNRVAAIRVLTVVLLARRNDVFLVSSKEIHDAIISVYKRRYEKEKLHSVLDELCSLKLLKQDEIDGRVVFESTDDTRGVVNQNNKNASAGDFMSKICSLTRLDFDQADTAFASA